MLQVNDLVRTFTDRIGVVREVRNDGTAVVNVQVRFTTDGRLDPPIVVGVTYLQSDLTPEDREDRNDTENL